MEMAKVQHLYKMSQTVGHVFEASSNFLYRVMIRHPAQTFFQQPCCGDTHVESGCRKRGVEFKGGSHHDLNHRNRQNRHGCLFVQR